MMRRSLTMLLACVLAGCGKRDAGAPAATTAETFKAPAIGDVAPVFAVATIGGDSARIGGTARQPVTLVNVWATWCGPCKAEFPELQTLHTTYAPRGLRVLAISIDTEADDVVTASARSMGATFTIGRDAADEVRGKFAAVGIPESWLISADGKLLWKHSGAIPAGDAGVRAAIDGALAAAGGL
ncbi:MAG TPA: TlpA disulfide reductase family protein [Gemmatimonadaceae bacterium]|nr:TlpA disulfide reductase family protein [Gemmatimonadaceae bacterium]